MVLIGDWTQLQIIHLKCDSDGSFGFGIVGGTSTGVVIKTIVPGSVADKDKRLCPGDHILKISNINVHGMSSQQVATLLRQQNEVVQLVVGRSISSTLVAENLSNEKNIEQSPDIWTMPTKSVILGTSLENEINNRLALVNKFNNKKIDNHLLPNMNNAQLSSSSDSSLVTRLLNDGNISQKSNIGSHDMTVIAEEEQSDINKGSHNQSPSLLLKNDNICSLTEMTTSKNIITDPDNLSPAQGTNIWENKKDIPHSSSADLSFNEEYKSNGKKDNKTSTMDNTETFSSQKLKLSADDKKALAGKNIASHISKLLGDSDVKANTISKKLPSKAMKYFHRDQWVKGQYEEVEVEIERNPILGLGITVAGYVHREEEINGVFVKSLVKDSSAATSKKIKIHDLISSVNGIDCQNLSHAESVKLLVNSGPTVKLKLIRFSQESPQAKCLKMLQEQENNAKMADIQANLIKAKNYWQSKLGTDFEILTVTLIPDKYDDGGLGISLEGTVDVVDGNQLCPHHYIESLRKDGPAAKSGCLKTGDELLQLNDKVLYGESHVTVRREISKARNEFKASYLVVARKATFSSDYEKSLSGCLPEAYNLLANINDDQLVKAKSETQLSILCDSEIRPNLIRSQSLQYTSGLAIWNCVPLVVTINKDSKGLGFSICDYHDPTHPNESVIIIRSLVPGGIAQADGRIVPGDRLMFVNSEDLSNCSLDKAVDILKSTPHGPVRLGIAKPVPVEHSNRVAHLPLISRSERLLAKSNSPRVGRRSYKKRLFFDKNASSNAFSCEDVYTTDSHGKIFNTTQYFPFSDYYDRLFYAHYRLHSDDNRHSITSSPCSSRSISPCFSPSTRGSLYENECYLPPSLERTIKILKGPTPLGIIFDVEVDKSINGCVIKHIHPRMAIARDGRIQIGDHIIRINSEKFRNVTCSQAKIMLKRLNYVGNQVTITYITSADAKLWKEKYGQEADNQIPMINRLSPKVFPKFYQSPFMNNNKEINNFCATETNSITSIASDSQMDINKTECQDLPSAMSNGSLRDIKTTKSILTNTLSNSKDCLSLQLDEKTEEKKKEENTSVLESNGNLSHGNNFFSKEKYDIITKFASDFVDNIINELFEKETTFTPIKDENIISPMSPKSNDFDLEYEISVLTKTYDKASYAIKELKRDYSLSYAKSSASFNSSKDITSPTEGVKSLSYIQNIESPISETSIALTGGISSNPIYLNDENVTKKEEENDMNTLTIKSDKQDKTSSFDIMTCNNQNIDKIEKNLNKDKSFSSSLDKEHFLVTETPSEKKSYVLKSDEEIYKDVGETAEKFVGTSQDTDNIYTAAVQKSVSDEEKGVSIITNTNNLFNFTANTSLVPLISNTDGSKENSIQFISMKDEIMGRENLYSKSNLLENKDSNIDGDKKNVKQTMSSSSTIESEDKELSEEMIDGAKFSTNQLMRSRFWGQPRNVILNRESNKSFGISIVGGRIEVSQRGNSPGSGNTVSGIFIKSVLPDSPAGKSNSLNMGDRVLSVNDIDLRDATHEYAVKVIKSAVNPVKFCVQSLQTFSPQNFKNRLNASLNKELILHNPPEGTSINDDVVFKQIGKQPISQPNLIKGTKLNDSEKDNVKNFKMREKDSAAFLEKLSTDLEEEDIFGYTNNKVIRKYTDLPGKPIIIRIKNIPSGGLDLSLTENNGNNSKKSIFVMGITSPSPLLLENGDELLEINGHVLLQMNRKQAKEKIQQCMKDAELSLIILRCKKLDNNDKNVEDKSFAIDDKQGKRKISSKKSTGEYK
uniref:Inactivation-no-after-D protein n=1 Tax=Parastrongyloides trichosuri TaxID=131310 RepID=A0A0N4ZHJ6_PARTI